MRSEPALWVAVALYPVNFAAWCHTLHGVLAGSLA